MKGEKKHRVSAACADNRDRLARQGCGACMLQVMALVGMPRCPFCKLLDQKF